jgi:acetyl coenzyme A synthetase (ADP forming)-like protein
VTDAATPVKPLYLPPPPQERAESGRLILRDGTAAQLRVASPTDRAALGELFARLSPESRHRRFLSVAVPSDKTVADLCDSSDPRNVLTLVVSRTVGGQERLIATGSYLAVGDDTAEVAFTVDDAFQGKGLGTLLLERLSLLAARHGFRRLTAVTQTDNRPMIDVFRESGFAVAERAGGGMVDIDLTGIAGEAGVARMETRDRVSTTASLRPFFRPKSVAVIGASRDPESIGYRVLEALISARFNGPVYPVNPKATVLSCIRCHASARDLPEPVDLAVICVPAKFVLQVVDDCAANGVKALVVISAGFAEVDAAGKELQRKLVDKVRGYGMRMVGPNCMGLLNAGADVRLNASFSPVFPPPGRIAMSSQSGALGLAIIASARNSNMGFATFVSVGNKADVSGNDLLQYWEEDPDTDVCLLYLESFGNPRRFARIARRVGRRKPIIAVKSGRSEADKRAAGSHTAALAAGDTAVAALFRQTGVIRAETLDEMFDLAAVLGNQPLPAGKRVGIITNAGGPAILCTDACEAGGLTVPELSRELRARLAAFLPAAAGLGNPVDMIASASPENYARTLSELLTSPDVDAVIVIYIPVGGAEADRVARVVADTVQAARERGGAGKPVIACLMSEKAGRQLIDAGPERIPSFPYPETPARVLGKVAAYAEWRAAPPGMIPDFQDMDLRAARKVCRLALATRGPGWLAMPEVLSLLTALRLPMPGGFARTPAEAVAAAEAAGFPVAVKLAAKTLVHKTEVGGVRLNLPDAAAVTAAFEGIRAKLAGMGAPDEMEGVVVQPMLRGGIELVVGVTQDPSFGPLVAFGLGGIHVEVLADVVFRVTPLTDRDADEMIRSVRGYKLIQGYRGHPPGNEAAIREVLLRISRMVEDIPEIKELDLNPVFAFPDRCAIVDARIKIGPPEG